MEIVAIFITFILAGIATELTGFGVATVSMALLPFFFPISVAVPIVAMISTTSTGIVALKTKTTGLWKHMLSLIIGSSIGVPAGILMLNILDENILRTILAVFLITYSVYGLLKKQTFIKATTVKSTAVGMVAGFSSALLSVHGPIVGSYASANRSFDRDETRDIIATYMFFAGVFTVVGHYLSSNITTEVVNNFLYSLPFLILGILIGSFIFKKMNEGSVRKFIYIFILTAGIMMMV